MMEANNDNTHLVSSAVKDLDGSLSDVHDDSDNDPNWEIKGLNNKGINIVLSK